MLTKNPSHKTTKLENNSKCTVTRVLTECKVFCTDQRKSGKKETLIEIRSEQPKLTLTLVGTLGRAVENPFLSLK